MKRKLIYTVLLLLLLAGGFVGWKLLGPATAAPERKYFYVRTGASYQDVKKDLVFLKIIPGEFWFDQVSKKLDYDKSVKAGRYEVKNGMSLLSLVRMLRSGNQSPVNFVINKLRTKEDLAARVGASFECDSLDFIHFINNPDSIKRYRLDSNTVMTAVIPNTYSLFWNSTPSRIFRKLANEQEKFWNEEREKKAAALGMTPAQVYTMASIVEEETTKEADKGKIASVYINRIETGMKLEADPTVKFAMKDFGLKRIFHKHLAFPSSYNTYLHTGLPPGPICTPSSKTIDAVLNAPQTNYIFFVAKPDWSGLSNFTHSYEEHMINAKNYQHFLDSVNIK